MQQIWNKIFSERFSSNSGHLNWCKKTPENNAQTEKKRVENVDKISTENICSQHFF